MRRERSFLGAHGEEELTGKPEAPSVAGEDHLPGRVLESQGTDVSRSGAIQTNHSSNK